MAIKTYDEFLNENLFGAYSYYGAGSLVPIVSKLASEGKSAQQIYSYLTMLGVDEERKRRSISKVFLNESFEFIGEGASPAEIKKVEDFLKKNGKYKKDEDIYVWSDETLEFDITLGTDNVHLYDGEETTVVTYNKFIKEWMNESFESVNEDAVDSLLDKKPEEPKKPSDSAVDSDVKKALDDLKSGDDETDKDVSDEIEKDDEEESNKIQVLKGALKDAEKLEKIKKILSETFELDFSEEIDVEYISGIFEYHSVLEKLSTEERKKLKDTDFVFSDTRSWPIHDERHAKTALVWATWPQYADKKAAIIKAVLKKYPQLKGVGAAK